MYYVPGFSNYLEDQILSEEAPLDGGYAGSYQSLPTQQPVQTAPYYGESYYSQPTAQPVQAAPYYGEPSYQGLPTAQPVYSEPYTESQSTLAPVQPETQYPPLDLGDWNPSMVNLNGLNVLSDPGPAYDPNSIFYFHTGSDIGVPNASGGFDYRGAHPIQYQAGQTYRMLDKKGNVVGTASSPAEMQALVAKSKSLPAYTMELVGNQYGNTLPSGGWLPSKTDAGSLGSMLTNMAALALPAVGGAALGPVLAGGLGTSAAVGTGLGTALGTAAAGTAAGKSIEDILLQSALSGLAAGGLSALTAPKGAPNVGDLQAAAIDTADTLAGLGVNPALANQIASGPLSGIGSVGGSVAGAGGSAAGSIAGTDALGNFIQVPGQVISNIPSSFLSGALGAATGALSGTNYGDQVFNQPSQPNGTSSDEIVVNAPKESIITAPPASLPEIIPPLSLVDIPPLAGTELPNVPEQPPETEGQGWDVVAPKENVVIAPPASLPEIIPPLSSVTIPPLAGTQLPEMPQQPPETEEPGWDVVAPKQNVVIPPPASLPELFPPLNSVTIPPGAGTQLPEVPENEIVVNAPPRAPNLLPEIIPPLSSVTIPPGAGTQLPQTPAETPATKEKSTLDKIKEIADYLQLAGLGIGAIGSLFGNGQQSAATIANAGNLGNLNPTFGAKLPGANIPGLGGGTSSAPRTAADLGQQGLRSTQDWYRYGYGPEQSFFNYVPQAQPNTSQAYTGYAKGGFAVEGPGDGREDKIPAMLSDGEYVIDAETVALLGNGSNKAGADMLDKFRVNVRKHKGRELARGDFSKNAKRPEQYLAGGRA